MPPIDADTVNEKMCKALCDELKTDKTIDLYLKVFDELTVKPPGWPKEDKAYELPYKMLITDGVSLDKLFIDLTAPATATTPPESSTTNPPFEGFKNTYTKYTEKINKFIDQLKGASEEQSITGNIYYSPYMLWRYLEIQFDIPVAPDAAAHGLLQKMRDDTAAKAADANISNDMTSTEIIQSVQSLADDMINEIKKLQSPDPPPNPDELGTQVTRNYMIAKYITFIKLITSIISKFLSTRNGNTALTLKFKNAHNVLMALGNKISTDISTPGAVLEYNDIVTRIGEDSFANLLKALGGKAGTSAEEATQGLRNSAVKAAKQPGDVNAARAVEHINSMIVEYGVLDKAIDQVLSKANTLGVSINVTEVEDQPIFENTLFNGLPTFLTQNTAKYVKATKRFAIPAGGGGRGSKSDSRSRKNRSRSRRR